MIKNKIRCAIYTRKSCEEGLEQDFNSLDAQREACEAYIKSQIHEGWVLIEKEYNDGGYSGGTMERPAFKELMQDIKDDKIDIVVVYKVDRLTRSLMDFSKIIEVFDKHEASFVSITQQFNTTTSMGRLTLNILLSFAQFEREVTGERIRDKFEASRKKGLWIAGATPYGYNKQGSHILVPEYPYANNLQKIFELYLELGTVEKLYKKLPELNILSRNKKPFSRGMLYRILSDKVYIGKITHKDNIYEGQHEPLVSEDLFEKVQNLLKLHSQERKFSTNAKDGSLLTGLIYDDMGNRMTPSHGNKKGKRYRYYITKTHKLDPSQIGAITKISAGEIEDFIKNQLIKFIKNNIQENIQSASVSKQKAILRFVENYQPDKIFIQNSINQICLQPNEIFVEYDSAYIFECIKSLFNNSIVLEESPEHQLTRVRYEARISTTSKKHNKITISGKANYNEKLIEAVVKSFWYNKLGAEGLLTKDIRNSRTRRLAKVRFLAPEILESILNGTQDPELTIKELTEMANKIA